MRTFRAFLFPLALVGFVACSDSTGVDSGKISILLTDAPGDVKSAVVTISQIYLQGSGRVVLRDDPVTIDLLELADSTAMLVDEATVPAGAYSQLRFVVTDAYIEVENADGTTSIYASSPGYAALPLGSRVAGELQMPSLAQSGLKVNLPGGEIRISGDQRILLVDFDVAQSFGHVAHSSTSTNIEVNGYAGWRDARLTGTHRRPAGPAQRRGDLRQTAEQRYGDRAEAHTTSWGCWA